ncbi:uncharacterized protein [Coffea arabica]|uniref:Uncharacterized protein isoform X2 n=1 Tax=Coffea arabica TaxID=13443 RepID=A0ABM4VU90_COFAR
MPLLSPKFSLSFFLTILFCLLLSAYSEPGFTSLLRYRLLSIRCCLVFTPPRCGTHRCYGRRSLVSLTELKLWLWGSLFLRPHKPHRASASRVLWVSLVQISCRPFLLLRWNFLVLLLCYILLHCLSMEPLRVSEIHSSLSQWTSVIQVYLFLSRSTTLVALLLRKFPDLLLQICIDSFGL